ncbi:MAG: DUF3955 domain-containing protein [Erysipelothrix sp.]|nr:DUF3955 domain-containing protein [Erysipelothrix sp.]
MFNHRFNKFKIKLKASLTLKIALISAIIANLCLFAYSIIGSSVDVNGFLQEPFFLVPIAYFFVLIAIISGLLFMAKESRSGD